jgi:RNA polymerase sigma factor (sigma-70 family)
MMPEAVIVALCRKNDRRAQQQLFDCYKGRVLSICLRYAATREEADDILQEAFIRIFESLFQKSDGEIRSLSGWITSVTINTAINHYYKNKKHYNVPLSYAEESSAADVGGILETLQTEDLLSLIQTMPEGYRLIFNLYIIEGFSHQEIGERISISESASRSQLTRAKEWLRNRLVANEITV